MITQYLDDMRREFSDYRPSVFVKDLLAGLTVAAVALPLALAFGVSSGADAASGLVTAIFAGLIIGILGGAPYQVSGPTGTMAAILLPLSATYGIQGVLITGFLSGVILLVAALLKAGRLVSIIPSAVITGFTAGIAILIAGGQIDHFFGTTSSGSTLLQSLASYRTLGFAVQWQPLMFGLLVVFIMVFWPKKWATKLPSSLIAIIVALVVNLIGSFSVIEVGSIPKALILEQRFHFSDISFENLRPFITPAIGVAAIGMVESLLAGAAGEKMTHMKMDPDRWLISQALGNLVMPFLGGVPATAAIARTSVSVKAGMRTRVTNIVHSVVLILSMFLLGPLMGRIPLAALAGVLMITSWRMNDWLSIKRYFKHLYKTSIAQFIVTMAATVIFGLTTAILVGIGLSMVLFVIRSSNLEIAVSNIDERHEKGKNLSAKLTKVRLVYVTGQLFFGSIDNLITALEELQGVSTIILSIRGVPSIDHSAMLELEQLHSSMQNSQIALLFCGLQPQVQRQFSRAGFDDVVGRHNIFANAVEAIDSLQNE
ncbi:MAG: SulP family inorganic anion transporter [Sphaerochaetaceae bacterium]